VIKPTITDSEKNWATRPKRNRPDKTETRPASTASALVSTMNSDVLGCAIKLTVA